MGKNVNFGKVHFDDIWSFFFGFLFLQTGTPFFREISQFVKMAIDKRLREAIATFYEVNRAKGVNFTYQNFKKVAPKTTIYRIVKFQDERGSISRKDLPSYFPKKLLSKCLINSKTKSTRPLEKVWSHYCNQK